MLITCPECRNQVSDKATACPHCGYPIKQSTVKRRPKLPNGFGRIVKIPQCRNNPYRVTITVGKTADGKTISKILKPQGYFKTYNDAYKALVEYHENPYDLAPDITVSELYEKWFNELSKVKSDNYLRSVNSAYSYCHAVHGMNVKNIRARHIKGCMEDGYILIPSGPDKGKIRKATPNTKLRIKSFWNLFLDYALEYEVVDKNYARTFDASQDIVDESDSAKRQHIPFTDEELDILWGNSDNRLVSIILIQCYSGWRPRELCELKLEDVDLETMVFKGGLKTKAGKNRVVPIHSCIQDLVRTHYEYSSKAGSAYLFTMDDGKTHKSHTKLTYDKYSYRFEKLMKALNMNEQHRPHDPRKQFITMAKKFGCDEYAIKILVGHEITDVTEKVYTDRSIEWLRKDIEKIKEPDTLGSSSSISA